MLEVISAAMLVKKVLVIERGSVMSELLLRME